jgi:hypothetical protein
LNCFEWTSIILPLLKRASFLKGNNEGRGHFQRHRDLKALHTCYLPGSNLPCPTTGNSLGADKATGPEHRKGRIRHFLKQTKTRGEEKKKNTRIRTKHSTFQWSHQSSVHILG